MLKDDLDASHQLASARTYLKKRNQTLAMLDKKIDRYLEDRMENESGPVKVDYLSRFESDIDLMGVGEHGALVKTKGYEYDYSLDSGLQWYRSREKISWVNEGETSKDIWSGYNVFGDVGLSRDGDTVSFSEDLFGAARTITVWHAGETRRIATDADAYFFDLTPSPSGQWVAGYRGPCNRCPAGERKRNTLFIRDRRTGEEIFAQPHGVGRYVAFAWSTDDQLLVIHRLPEREEEQDAPQQPSGVDDAQETATPDARDGVDDNEKDPAAIPTDEQTAHALVGDALPPTPEYAHAYYKSMGGTTLWAVRPSDLETPNIVHEFDVDTSVTGLFASETHAFLPIWSGGALLMELALKGDAHREFILQTSVTDLQLSPDGQMFTFRTGGGTRSEIAAMPRTGGPIQPLTENDHMDHRPYFSRNGQEILFESLGENPAYTRRRRASSIVKLTLPKADVSPRLNDE